MSEIFTEFEIQGKVISVTTDNASNYVAAFKNYRAAALEDLRGEYDDPVPAPPSEPG